ncbi:hypothetical protein ACJMK2_004435 [Sinanodonta woodiana]|uniref:Uncharacterized protein n=1 Tax=Sinanodonta woodiana TaxID=1069815 RepID=A0ABD3Y2V1_SINWO
MPSTVNRASSFGSTKRSLVIKSGSSIKRHTSFRSMSRDKKETDERLTLDILQSLSPFEDGKDKVTEAARTLLLNCLKMEPHVHDVFFPEALKDHRIDPRDLRGFPLKKLATALVAQAISGIKNDQKFYGTIDRSELDSVLNDVYDSLHWKKLGFSLYTKLYPEEVRDAKTNISLTDYIEDDGHNWAERLLATIMDPRWTLLRMQHIIRGLETEEEYNREMNALFVKLHLLDPQSVIPAYQFLLNQKALPAVNLELATRNYLGGPLNPACIEKDVAAALLKTSMPMNVSRLSLNDIEVFSGVEVDEFIVTECRNIGVWNGTRPNNIHKSKVTDRCCVM